MHICPDEILLALSAVPFVGYYFRRLHGWYHKKFKHPDHAEETVMEVASNES